MVVLAASVVTKSGKALVRSGRFVSRRSLVRSRPRNNKQVARVYFDMTRIRIEGLLAAFPKLVRTGWGAAEATDRPADTPPQVGSGKQHTYVETENVRYVYQPLEARAGRGRRGCRGVRALTGSAATATPRACSCSSSPTSRATSWRTWTRCGCSPKWCPSTAGCALPRSRSARRESPLFTPTTSRWWRRTACAATRSS